MVQEAISGDALECEAISLSTGAASIISAKYTYDVCVDPTVDRTKQQNVIKYYTVVADVLNVVICMPTAGFTDYLNLLINIIGLLA